jgi:putative endonuclease (uncharacterized protein DUF1780)
MARNDDNYVEALRKDAADARALMSNRQKPKRERMVVRALLRCLGVAFEDTEIVVGTEEPVDVAFRAARFQVRDLVGDRKRGKEWAEREQRYRDAKTVSDVMTRFAPSTAIPFDRAAKMVAQALTEKSRRYGLRVCRTLDAVAYIDLGGSHLYPSEPGSQTSDALTELSRQGWRSVSMLSLPYGIVLTANEEAPEFLRLRLGSAYSEWPGPDGWFEADDE